MDPQYSPAVTQRANAGAMVRMLQTVAQTNNVPVFHRYAIMNHWRTVENVPFDRFIVNDGLHMNDWSYGCIAKLLATSIVAAVNQPTIATRSLVQEARL
jgi:acyl-CoA thioesterase-1